LPEVEEALRGRLITFPAVNNLVGDRVYPDQAPQNATYPYIVFQRISTPRATAMGMDPMLAWPRFQLSILAREDLKTAYENAKDVVIAARAALRRFKGTQDGVVIQDIMLLDENDIEAPDAEVQGIALDIMIWHGE
jgi:uncharacterized protein DUF3168